MALYRVKFQQTRDMKILWYDVDMKILWYGVIFRVRYNYPREGIELHLEMQ